jgi:hypothetical protein
MKKLVTFASDIRINALLCCSATVLLTACGGAMNDTGTGAQTQTAAYVQSDVAASDANGAATTPNTVDATAAQATEATGNGNFELVGYVTNPLAASTADAAVAPAAVTAQDAPAAEAAPAAGAPRLLAMVTSVPTTTTTAAAAVTNTAQGSATAQLTTPATTYNYYVSPTGNDSAVGTKAAPFKTLAKAAKMATKASTTVWVAPGTYAGGIKTTANGTASGRIYWVSTTKWGAKVVPPSSSSNNNAWDNRGNYVSIVGFDIDGTNSGSGTKWTHGIYTGGSYGMIANNHIHNVAKTVACTSAGGSAIGVDSYYHGVLTDVVGNVVNDIGPKGCTYVQGIYFSTSGTIKNNLVYRVGAVAIHLWHDATNVIITNNTVTTSNFGMVIGGGDFYYNKTGANNVFVANNIVYDNKYGISEQGTTGKNNQYKNNLVFKNPTYNISLRNGLAATGTVSSDPLFKAYSTTAATPDFHLSSSSPAIGRGVSTNAYATDLDGKARSASTGYDIGAYQH